MKQIAGNILDVQYGIIGQQVNCKLIMGAGLAKQIREKYPIVFSEYKRVMSAADEPRRLGKCQIVEVASKKLYVANLFGQHNFLPRGIQHTDYTALGMALRSLAVWRDSTNKDLPIYLPYCIGCGLAGGNWNVVQGVITDAIPSAIIVRL